MDERHYVREERTIDLAKANGLGCLIYFPVFVVYWLPFHLLWGGKWSIRGMFDLFKMDGQPWLFFTLVMLCLVVGIVLHELIHGISWAVYAKNGWKSIKFGVLWKYLTPYCHCKDPLTIKQYTFGAVMPFIVLGLLPAVLSWFTGSVALLAFGIFFTASAVGDFMIMYRIRKEPAGTLIMDHPSEAGYYVFLEQQIGSRDEGS